MLVCYWFVTVDRSELNSYIAEHGVEQYELLPQTFGDNVHMVLVVDKMIDKLSCSQFCIDQNDTARLINSWAYIESMEGKCICLGILLICTDNLGQPITGNDLDQIQDSIHVPTRDLQSTKCQGEQCCY